MRKPLTLTPQPDSILPMKSTNPDIRSIVETLRITSENVKHYATQLDQAADNLEEKGDLNYVVDAFSVIAALNSNLRADRVVSRLVRIAQKQIPSYP